MESEKTPAATAPAATMIEPKPERENLSRMTNLLLPCRVLVHRTHEPQDLRASYRFSALTDRPEPIAAFLSNGVTAEDSGGKNYSAAPLLAPRDRVVGATRRGVLRHVRLQSRGRRGPAGQDRRQTAHYAILEYQHGRIFFHRRAQGCRVPPSRHRDCIREPGQAPAYRISAQRIPAAYAAAHAQSRAVPADQPGQSLHPSRCSGIPGRSDRAAHAFARGSTCDGVAIAGERV